MMQRTTVASSNMASIGYDPDTQTLEIEFMNGSIYQYFDVPLGVFEGLKNASSHGEFFNEQIKGHYRYARV